MRLGVGLRGMLRGGASHIVAFRTIYTDSPLSFAVASPGAWWSTEKALLVWTRSSRLQAKAETFGSIDYITDTHVNCHDTCFKIFLF